MRMRKHEGGHWEVVGLSRRYDLKLIDHWTYCEGPHPERYRDANGVMVRGYCYGGEEHPTTTWVVETEDGGEVGMGFDTRREALMAAVADDAYRSRTRHGP